MSLHYPGATATVWHKSEAAMTMRSVLSPLKHGHIVLPRQARLNTRRTRTTKLTGIANGAFSEHAMCDGNLVSVKKGEQAWIHYTIREV